MANRATDELKDVAEKVYTKICLEMDNKKDYIDDLVSIVMPAYNSGEFIADSIKSILVQTYPHWELLITDDCSTDNTVEVIKELSKNDERIKLFVLEKNGGAAVARNNSLEHVRGRFIAFLDSDDMWLPEKLNKQINFMRDNNYPISFTSYEVLDEYKNSTNTIINSVNKIDYKGFLKNTIIGMSTSMIDSSIVGEFRLINLRANQDACLWASLLRKGFIAYGIFEILAQYRVRSGSISYNKFKAAKNVWFMYYNVEKLGLMKSAYYFTFYVFNAIKKRL